MEMMKPNASAMKWVRENQEELKRYGGKWVAVGAKGVYETGDNYDEIMRKLKKAGAIYPLVFEVRPGFKEA